MGGLALGPERVNRPFPRAYRLAAIPILIFSGVLLYYGIVTPGWGPPWLSYALVVEAAILVLLIVLGLRGKQRAAETK